jgi:GMP synthase (glutamine-hydrolysing)
VSRAPRPERGWIDVARLPEDGAAPAGPYATTVDGRWFAWHDDHIAPPPGSTVLARSELCVQGFSVGAHLGVQFHPEVTVVQVEDWLTQDRRLRQLEALDEDAEQLLQTTRGFEGQAAAAAALLYESFFGPA